MGKTVKARKKVSQGATKAILTRSASAARKSTEGNETTPQEETAYERIYRKWKESKKEKPKSNNLESSKAETPSKRGKAVQKQEDGSDNGFFR